MYNPEFESKHFLKTKKDVLDHIDYASYDKPDELVKYFHEIEDYSITALIEEVERIFTDVAVGDGADAKKTIVKELIQVKLGLGFEIHYLLDMLQEEFTAIQKAFKELEKYKDHRHKTLMNLYTEKPVY